MDLSHFAAGLNRDDDEAQFQCENKTLIPPSYLPPSPPPPLHPALSNSFSLTLPVLTNSNGPQTISLSLSGKFLFCDCAPVNWMWSHLQFELGAVLPW